MDESACTGCRTSFQDHEALPLDSCLADYQDYQVPVKQDKARWALLRGIVSFLNAQGGAIYLGIDPTKGTVVGQKLSRKEQDSFKLFMKQLLEKVHPKVDLNHRQEVVVQFVPVLQRKEFGGKYVVKIVVQQGDPSRVYYFGERIKLEGQMGKVDEIEVFYGYQRDERGGTVQIKGTKLLQAIHEKGTTPNKQAIAAHEGCHPEPPHLQLQIRKIHFSNTSLDDFITIEAAVESYLGGIDFEISYLEGQAVSCMEVDDEEEFKLVMAFMQENIQQWNREAFKDMEIFFELKGEKDHYILIENNPKGKKQHREERPQKKQEVIGKDSERKPFFNKQPIKQPQKKAPVVPRTPSAGPPSHFPKKYSLTFTPISPQTSKQLENFLLNSIYTKMEKYSALYKHTIEIFLGSENDFNRYSIAVMKNQQTIASFARKSTICLGRNQGFLRIRNYNRFRMDQMLNTLKALMEEDLKQGGLVKEGPHYSIMLRMKNQQTACIWLDNLLEGKHLQEFTNPSKGNGVKIIVQLELA